MAVAVVFVVVLAGLGVFQLALACGAPLGRFAWGGQHAGVLPVPLRIGSACALPLYAAFAVAILDRAGAIDVVSDGVARVGVWIVVAFMGIGIVMNAISPSKPERYTMTPVTVLLTATSLPVALG